jgi:ABC-type phosphate transport system permease subunit
MSSIQREQAVVIAVAVTDAVLRFTQTVGRLAVGETVAVAVVFRSLGESVELPTATVCIAEPTRTATASVTTLSLNNREQHPHQQLHL